MRLTRKQNYRLLPPSRSSTVRPLSRIMVTLSPPSSSLPPNACLISFYPHPPPSLSISPSLKEQQTPALTHTPNRPGLDESASLLTRPEPTDIIFGVPMSEIHKFFTKQFWEVDVDRYSMQPFQFRVDAAASAMVTMAGYWA